MGIAVVLVCLAGTGWQGYRMGYAAAAADYNEKALAQIEAGEKLEVSRRSLARERDELARKLEEEANADPVIVERCLSPDRVRRLNRLH